MFFAYLEQLADGLTRSERRRGGRMACRLLKSNYGRVLEISSIGARTHSRWVARGRVGATVQLKIKSLDGQLSVPAKVIRVDRSKHGGYETGFQFLEMPDDCRKGLSHILRVSIKSEMIGDQAADRLCA